MYDIEKYRTFQASLDAYAGAVFFSSVILTIGVWWLIDGKGWWTLAWFVAYFLFTGVMRATRQTVVDKAIEYKTPGRHL